MSGDCNVPTPARRSAAEAPRQAHCPTQSPPIPQVKFPGASRTHHLFHAQHPTAFSGILTPQPLQAPELGSHTESSNTTVRPQISSTHPARKVTDAMGLTLTSQTRSRVPEVQGQPLQRTSRVYHVRNVHFLCAWFAGNRQNKTRDGGGQGRQPGGTFENHADTGAEGFLRHDRCLSECDWANPDFDALLERLSHLTGEDLERVRELSGLIRDAIEGTPIGKEIEEAVAHQLATLGETEAYAVRSSATAEDLEAASFAGQQDTFRNIIGKESVLKHIRKCWASLFTDRAVIYRMKNGVDHRTVALAVVIQKMVFPQASGILFTADPATSNRKIVAIDAGFGLGEALVSGRTDPDHYRSATAR